MAKRGILEHPKTLRLARKLGIEPWAAVGLLECFWHWCARYAITGVITSDPEDFADGIRYNGNAKDLFYALQFAGFIDELGDGRIVVHDARDHADNTWKQNLKDAGLSWWDGSSPFKPRASESQENASFSNPACKPLMSDSQEHHENLASVSPQPEPEPYKKKERKKEKPEAPATPPPVSLKPPDPEPDRPHKNGKPHPPDISDVGDMVPGETRQEVIERQDAEHKARLRIQIDDMRAKLDAEKDAGHEGR